MTTQCPHRHYCHADYCHCLKPTPTGEGITYRTDEHGYRSQLQPKAVAMPPEESPRLSASEACTCLACTGDEPVRLTRRHTYYNAASGVVVRDESFDLSRSEDRQKVSRLLNEAHDARLTKEPPFTAGDIERALEPLWRRPEEPLVPRYMSPFHQVVVRDFEEDYLRSYLQQRGWGAS